MSATNNAVLPDLSAERQIVKHTAKQRTKIDHSGRQTAHCLVRSVIAT